MQNKFPSNILYSILTLHLNELVTNTNFRKICLTCFEIKLSLAEKNYKGCSRNFEILRNQETRTLAPINYTVTNKCMASLCIKLLFDQQSIGLEEAPQVFRAWWPKKQTSSGKNLTFEFIKKII